MADLRPLILERDEYICQNCGGRVMTTTAEVEHIRPVRRFKRPIDANTPDNLWTLCKDCHTEKTKSDRQAESRVRVRHEAYGCNERSSIAHSKWAMCLWSVAVRRGCLTVKELLLKGLVRWNEAIKTPGLAKRQYGESRQTGFRPTGKAPPATQYPS